jgi:hypothetical protein
MPEVKNNFLKSKMNKDLDARILPNGEYRDAQNVNVSKSEGEDVGSLENVLGNVLLSDFGLSDECGLEIIGKYMDVDNNRIFAMLTNYTDTSADKLSNHTIKIQGTPINDHIKCYICVYNISTDTGSVIVEGPFLNFSRTHQIYGIDLIEDQLFWTDNRNQPRKINVTTAINDPSYYYTEEHISVAKYAPFLPIQFVTGGGISTMLDTVREFLPDGTTANPTKVPNWDGDEDFLEDKFIRFSYRLKFDDNEYSLIAPFSQIAFIPQEDGYFIRRGDGVTKVIDKDNLSSTYRSTEVSFMQNKVTQIGIKIPPITNGIDPVNPLGLRGWDNVVDEFKVKQIEILYKESNSNAIKVVKVIDAVDLAKTPTKLIDSSGNLNYIYKSEKPIKTLPASQTTRVSDTTPVKALAQSVSGNRVIYGNYQDKHSYPSSLNYQASVVDKTYSDAVEYPNHTLKQNRSYDVGIILSDIYGRQSGVITASLEGFSTVFNNYKESGFSEVSPLGDITTWVGDMLNVDFFETIPTTSNLQGYPGLHSEFNPLGWFSYKVVVQQKEQEYYNIYFPGILNGYVFENPTPPPTALVEASTIINPTCHIVIHGDNINKIPRDLKEVGPEQKLFRTSKKKPDQSQDDFVAQIFDFEFQAGNLIASNISTNAQTAQNLLTQVDVLTDQRAQLLRDLARQNVTRETTENSSVQLYGRVTNFNYTLTQAGGTVPGLRNSKQFYPYTTNGTIKDEVVTIAKLTDLGLLAGDATGWALDGDTTDPLVGKLIVKDITIGATATGGAGNMLPTISVYETEPFESQIDIYWETTTTGLIEELNNDIIANTTETVNLLRRGPSSSGVWNSQLFKTNVSEGVNPVSSPVNIIINDELLGAFNSFTATLAPDIDTSAPGSMSLVEAKDNAGNIVTNKFNLTSGSPLGYYRLDLVDYVTFSGNQSENEFYFTIEVTEALTQISSQIVVGPFVILNLLPSFLSPFPTLGTGSISGGSITFNNPVKAINGSADPVNNTNGLTFTVESQTDSSANPVNYFYTTPSGINGQAALANNPAPQDSYKVTFRVTDAGNAFAISLTTTVNIS